MKKTNFLVVLLLVICFATACTKSNETFTVTFDTDGGSNVTTVEVYEKQLVSKPATPTKEGYTFLGWYLNDTAFDFSTKITKDITLTAKWSINNNTDTNWNVTFDPNGGSSVANKQVKDGETLSSNITTTRDGYTFLGWYLGETKFDFSTKITKDIKLTAKWEKKNTTANNTNKPTETKYTVSFDPAGGSSTKNQSVVANEKAQNPTTPTRDGYTFLGWYLGETKFDFSTKITKDIKLTAKWEKKVVEPKYSYIWEKIESSVAGEYYLYITKDGKKIAGTASLTSKSGKVATANIPVTGLKIVKDTIAEVSNIKEN